MSRLPIAPGVARGYEKRRLCSQNHPCTRSLAAMLYCGPLMAPFTSGRLTNTMTSLN
jgi:hypothetical protein